MAATMAAAMAATAGQARVKQTRPFRACLVALGLVGLMAACTEREEILTGDRLDLRAPLDGTAIPVADQPAPVAQPISLPAVSANRDWQQRGGGVAHAALGASLAPLWATAIGTGDGRKLKISAEPVVAGGRVFTLDAAATVAATGVDGSPLWSRDLTPPADAAGEGSGGGIAYAAGRLYVTSGFGAVFALDGETGAVIWSQSADAPLSAAPTVSGGVVYVVAENSAAMAIDADTGKVKWQVQGTASRTGMFGGAGPVVTDRLVILAFPSGEVRAVLKDSGLQVWLANIGGTRLGRAYNGVPDIVGDPVIVGQSLVIGNQSGHMAAVDVGSGTRLWDADQGTYGGAVPAGGSLFLVSDAAELVRLDATTGALIWAVPLPEYTTDKVKKLKEVYANYGPVLAGGRLLVASGDGLVRSFDPASGALVSTIEIGGAASADPAVAAGVLYIVTSDGKLRAFR